MDGSPQAHRGGIYRNLDENGLVLPAVPDWADPVWHLYVVRSSDRDKLQQKLADAGIGTLIHYPVPPHMQEAYEALGLAHDSLPVAQQLADDVLSLPIGPHLQQEDMYRIVSEARNAI